MAEKMMEKIANLAIDTLRKGLESFTAYAVRFDLERVCDDEYRVLASTGEIVRLEKRGNGIRAFIP